MKFDTEKFDMRKNHGGIFGFDGEFWHAEIWYGENYSESWTIETNIQVWSHVIHVAALEDLVAVETRLACLGMPSQVDRTCEHLATSVVDCLCQLFQLRRTTKYLGTRLRAAAVATVPSLCN